MDSQGLEIEFDEAFAGDTLDVSRWIPHYLPHWSSWERTAANHAIRDGRLHLLIEDDQPPWCPQRDGDLRVSSLQTGLLAGPAGGSGGTHPFEPPAVVANGPHDIRRYTPMHGRFEVRMTASDDPRVMVAFWMIGLGDTRERTGEICVAEIFGRDVTRSAAKVGVGVKRQFDPSLVEAFEQLPLAIDATEMHDYAAEWRPDRVDFFVDGQLVKTVEQAIAYPMTLMLSIYEFPEVPDRPGMLWPVGGYPKRLTVEYVRGYRWVE